MGVLAAGIFAGQMVNFPLVGLQVSGHLMGGVLAAVVLGPWGAAIALSAVLVVQCLLFGDGGVLSLGANIFNMGLIGGTLGYAIYAAIRRAIPGPRGIVVGSVLASWLIIPVSALAFSIQMSAGGKVPFETLVTWMLFYHVLIGVGEALITGMVVSWIVRVRPDLIYGETSEPAFVHHWGRVVGAGLAVGLCVAVFAAPWASELSDGLEKVVNEKLVARDYGLTEREVAFAPFPDYSLPGPPANGTGQGGSWLGAVSFSAGIVTAMMGFLGTLVTFGVAMAIAGSAQVGVARSGAANVT
jgi:cobalt/nickel transport system permease protein